MTATLFAWTLFLLGWVLPLAEVLLTAKSGPWRPPPGSRCPLGPRPGWLVIVLLAGPLGWLLYRRGARTGGTQSLKKRSAAPR